MNILLAPDKFKGSLSAHEVCQALTTGIKQVNSQANIISRPLADGGDGSLDILDHYFDLETITLRVQDPLFRSINATYKLAHRTAYIEMSAASGLVLLKKEERNCMETSSIGTGELIRHAINQGVKQIYLFIGGSATNDGGIGIAHALGYEFKDQHGNTLNPIGKNLKLIKKIDTTKLAFQLDAIEFRVVCDVNNPFYGKNGAAYIYAPQKGATPQEVHHLDQGLQHLATLLKSNNYQDIANIPGAGAAGGVGGGSIAFLNAKLLSGIQTFLEITELEKQLQQADLVITGEGYLDAQTTQGKVISGVCDLAKRYKKPVIAVCGDAEKSVIEKLSLQEVYTIRARSKSLSESMELAKEKLIAIGEDIGRNWLG